MNIRTTSIAIAAVSSFALLGVAQTASAQITGGFRASTTGFVDSVTGIATNQANYSARGQISTSPFSGLTLTQVLSTNLNGAAAASGNQSDRTTEASYNFGKIFNTAMTLSYLDQTAFSSGTNFNSDAMVVSASRVVGKGTLHATVRDGNTSYANGVNLGASNAFQSFGLDYALGSFTASANYSDVSAVGRSAWTLQATQILSPADSALTFTGKMTFSSFNSSGTVTQGTYAGVDASFKF